MDDKIFQAELVNPPPPPKIYSVPRRFGIGTMMGVAALCGLLIAAMQQLDAPPAVIIVNGIFLALIGVMQAVMTKTPRWASVLVGTVCFAGWFVWLTLEFGNSGMPCFFVAMLLGGAIYGYLGGTMVAGMFLVFDALGKWFHPRPESDEPPPL